MKTYIQSMEDQTLLPKDGCWLVFVFLPDFTVTDPETIMAARTACNLLTRPTETTGEEDRPRLSRATNDRILVIFSLTGESNPGALYRRKRVEVGGGVGGGEGLGRGGGGG